MPIRGLKEQIAVARKPGGIYFNADGVYVGKARALRDRVRNTRAYGGIENRCCSAGRAPGVILTDSVVEALALENNLIKQRAPSTTSCCATTKLPTSS